METFPSPFTLNLVLGRPPMLPDVLKGEDLLLLAWYFGNLLMGGEVWIGITSSSSSNVQCPTAVYFLLLFFASSTSNPPHSSFSSRFAFASVVFPTAAAGTSTMKKLARLQMWWCWRCKNECAINPSPAHQFYDLFFPPSTAAFSFHIYFLLMCVWWSSVGWVTFAGH